nr:hypothetical protein GCM10020093_089270 [Planobispora longispora]
MEPGPALPILDRLRDDPSEYVRRSVANHVNDIAKDHPGVAVELLGRWRAEGGSHVEKVLRHAVRGLLRAGHPGGLELVGAAPGGGSVETLALDGDRVAVGDRLRFTVTVRADSPARSCSSTRSGATARGASSTSASAWPTPRPGRHGDEVPLVPAGHHQGRAARPARPGDRRQRHGPGERPFVLTEA